MLLPTVIVALCFASSTVLASGLDKPYYDLEDAENLFKDYVKEYGKVYNRREYFERLALFKERLVGINEQNEMFPTTVFSINYFTDLKPEEMKQYLGLRPTNATMKPVRILPGPVAAPDEFDWRKQGVVSHVKNQKDCGSCYIFSAVGNIEGQYAIKHKQCIALSEGQVLDCLRTATCNGGIMADVMNGLSQQDGGGLMKEHDYTYTPQKGTCKKDTNKFVAHVLSGQTLDTPDENVLKQTVHDVGPLAVALDASDFFSYKGGILKPNFCQDSVDHAVLLVGYGEENGEKFWIIKNSWGEGWGDAGYVRLQRGVGACAIGTMYTATSTVG